MKLLTLLSKLKKVRAKFRNVRNTRKLGAIVLATLTMVLIISFVWVQFSQSASSSPIHLAVVAPKTGIRSEAAQEMIQSTQLYLDTVNQQGGVNGHPLKLLIFDDKGDRNVARQIPQQIAKSPALAVLGHLNSSTAVEAAPGYKDLEIPAITGTASEDFITANNPYYFRTVFTNSIQGSVVALYMQKALNLTTASIIYSDDRLGRTLDQAFEETFKRKGKIQNVWKFDPKQKDLTTSVNSIIQELATKPDAGVVFLAMEEIASKDFIVAMRRRGLKTSLFASQSLARETAPQLFADYEEEKQKPGYFLEGIYIPTPLIFDSAGVDAQEFATLYQKRYGEPASYVGAAYYDVARVIVWALQKAMIENTPSSIRADRQKIRNQLEQINSRELGIKGLNGLIYFNSSHDNTPPVRIGKYVSQRFISAPIQFSPIENLASINLEEELKAGNILELTFKLKKQYFWRQDVVYTGIDINKIGRVDQSKSSFSADFYLWMRYTDNITPTTIQFPNGVTNSVNQNLPLFDATKPLRSEVINGLNYRLYQIQGEFKGSFDFRDYPFDQQKLQIYFQNTNVPSDRLIYVIDVFGLKLSETPKNQRKKPYQSLQLWRFEDIQYARETFSSNSTRGNPRLFNTNLRIDYSGLSVIITLQRQFSVFLVKTLLPLILLALVLGSTLYFSENLAKERLTVPIATLLSSAVLLTSINNQLSDTGYTVAIEYGFYVFFTLCLLCILVGLVLEKLRSKGHKTAITYLNYTSRILYVVIILVTIFTYAVVYGNRL
ncbi:ABC-type branched-chain amino acid transport system, periplasmic component [Synechococcus sp. PCC 7502]|uniref:ABC transporter substrate-binding protein n=1 Tax=Synechococcus sp. PCC 7502 TaxID=1173263 RepID=UPI00029FF786|nr:ABC transporter substrate-binding protein [Synechococcus sp. PCC 7502]AFY72807.1 ABC-type branched-chain amino acid transport system, periplasmic component [Synechococcus sp. PCC 7502]